VEKRNPRLDLFDEYVFALEDAELVRQHEKQVADEIHESGQDRVGV
jgi:hypothetical protein